MKGKNQPLVTNQPVESQKHPISGEFPNIIEEFRGYTLNYICAIEICEHVTGRIWKL
jgi:hypothetical protein